MAVIIQIHEYIASIYLDKWTSADSDFATLLSNFNQRTLQGFYCPWPDYTLAEMACKALGGKIIEATDPPEYVPGRVY